MEKNLQSKSYQEGDEAHIVRLFQLVFGRPMTLDYWHWRFRDNPAGRPQVELAWDGEILAGHYAVSPVWLSVKGQKLQSALSMTTMTHPDYRGLGLFTSLATTLYGRMADSGYDLVWGFPNAFSHRGFCRDLQWGDIYEIPTFSLPLEAVKRTPDVPAQISESDRFDEGFNDLWESLRDRYAVIVRRDQSYLDWRYTKNPEHHYAVLTWKEAGRVLGYATCKPYQDCLDVVDFLTFPEPNIARGLLAAIIAKAKSMAPPATKITMWLPLHDPVHQELEKWGFKNTEPVTYFGCRPLGKGADKELWFEWRNWYFTMGDSDVY